MCYECAQNAICGRCSRKVRDVGENKPGWLSAVQRMPRLLHRRGLARWEKVELLSRVRREDGRGAM